MTFEEAYATPDGVSDDVARLCRDLRQYFKKAGLDYPPSYKVFRTGEEHADYGDYCTEAPLVLVYEGTDVQHLFSWEAAMLDSYEGMQVMNDFLEERGWYHESGTSYYGGFYRS